MHGMVMDFDLLWISFYQNHNVFWCKRINFSVIWCAKINFVIAMAVVDLD